MTDKSKGILIYIFSIIAGLIFLFSKDSSRDVKMHAAQSITIFGAYVIVSIAYSIIPITIPFLSTIIYMLYAAAIIMGIVKVCKEEDPELPLVGELAKKIFGKQIEG